MEKKKDLRVIKTQNLLYNTLLELMKNKSFEEIKVSDICNTALINRSTFYAHYNDKYELLVDFINNLKSNLSDVLEKNEHIINTKEYYIEMIKLLLDQIDEKKDLYHLILLNNRNSIVLDILLDVVNKDVKKRIQNDLVITSKIPSEIVSKFFLGAIISVGTEWLENPNKYTKQELIDYLNILLPDNISQF